MAQKVRRTGEAVFTKQKLLTFARYANRRDLLLALLEDNKAYTLRQADAAIANFMKKTC